MVDCSSEDRNPILTIVCAILVIIGIGLLFVSPFLGIPLICGSLTGLPKRRIP